MQLELCQPDGTEKAWRIDGLAKSAKGCEHSWAEFNRMLFVRAALCGSRLCCHCQPHRGRNKSIKESLVGEWRAQLPPTPRQKNETGKEVVIRQHWHHREDLSNSREKTEWGTGGWGQPEAPLHQDKGRKAVNNKLIRNGCKIAMDEKLDGVQGKKKPITEQWAVSLHPLCGDWQVTSSQSRSCT